MSVRKPSLKVMSVNQGLVDDLTPWGDYKPYLGDEVNYKPYTIYVKWIIDPTLKVKMSLDLEGQVDCWLYLEDKVDNITYLRAEVDWRITLKVIFFASALFILNHDDKVIEDFIFNSESYSKVKVKVNFEQIFQK